MRLRTPIHAALLLAGSLHTAVSGYQLTNRAVHGATYWAAEHMGYIPEESITEPMLKSYVVQQAVEAGISPVWAVALFHVESAEGTANLSAKGALGPMQVMPGSAHYCGTDKEGLKDPKTNIRCGIKWMGYFLKLYKGDIMRATVAYNCGENRMKNPPEESLNHWSKVSRYMSKDTLT